MSIKNISRLAGAIVVCELAGVMGAFFTTPAIPTWYAELTKPALTPPSWIFAPVWTTLFALMGIAVFLVWQRGWRRKDVRVALGVFVFQLCLNTAWSIIFFGFKNPGFALFEIILLWFAIVWTIIFFARISKAAAVLLVPYIVWVSFAAYLNYMIWMLN